MYLSALYVRILSLNNIRKFNLQSLKIKSRIAHKEIKELDELKNKFCADYLVLVYKVAI